MAVFCNGRASLLRCLLTGSVLSLGMGCQAFAAEFPVLTGEVVTELQNEYTVDSDDAATDGYNNMFMRTEVAPTLRFNDYFFVDGVLVFEPILDHDGYESNYFDAEGAFIEEVKLNYENGPLTAFVGKFNPGFGIAWDFGRGIWGEDFAEDYEITERIGFGGAYKYEDAKIGAHTLTLSTFFADTTLLSESVGTKRGNNDKADGGVSNTEDFSSFVVALEGEDLAGIENLYYKLGYRNQEEGDADIGGDNETGFVVSLGHSMSITDRVGVDVLTEYVDIENFEGGADDNQYFTTSVITTIDEQWNVTVGYTSRDIDRASSDVEDYLLQLSTGYDFGQGTTAELGWRSSEESGIDTNIVGGLIRHSFEF